MNELQRLAEFQDILADYQVSETGLDIVRDTRLVLLAAPTSSGRNTIITELMKSGEYHFVVSDTTRKPRVNNQVAERDGVEYWFRSEDDLLNDLKQGLFLEAAIIHDQQVSGISVRELKKAHSSGKIAITDIEIVGVDSILAIKPDTTVLFVVPPTFEEWHNRLAKRGEMHERELRRRMQSAAEEFRHALENDHYTFVINDQLSHAVEHIQQRVFSGHKEAKYQESARRAVEKLLVETEKFLQK